MAPIDLTLSDLEMSRSRSFRYWPIEERHSVIMYFLVVFDITRGVGASCSLLARGVFRCPSGLSCFIPIGSIRTTYFTNTRWLINHQSIFEFKLRNCEINLPFSGSSMTVLRPQVIQFQQKKNDKNVQQFVTLHLLFLHAVTKTRDLFLRSFQSSHWNAQTAAIGWKVYRKQNSNNKLITRCFW